MIALLLATLLAATEPPAGGEPAERRPEPLSEEDQAVLENLELLEKLELLQDLQIVDTGDDPDPAPEGKAQKGR